MNRFLLLSAFIFFILFSLAVSAETETIFEDSIKEGESATIDNIEYTAYEYNDYAGVRLSSNKYGSIILEEEGEITVKGYYTFTLDEIIEEDDEVSFKITVEKEVAEVSISREVSNSTVHLDQQVTITVEITNSGTDTATVKYAEAIPSEVHIIGLPEIKKGTSTSNQKSTVADVYWSGALYSGETVTITYLIEIDNYPSSGSTLSLNDVTFTYKDDSGEYTETVDTLSLSLTEPITISFELQTEEESITVGSEAEYTIILDNNLDNTVTISSFVLEIPSSVSVSSIDTQLKKIKDEDNEDNDEYAYNWSGSLNPFEDVSFFLFIVPEGAGTHTLKAEAIYTYGSGEEAYDTSETTDLTISVGDVIPEIKLSSNDFDGGEQIIIYYYVNNSDEDVSYSNVDIKIESEPELFERINYIAALPKNTKTLIKKQNFTAPYTDTALEYEVTISGDLGGGALFEETATVSINPSTFTTPYALSYTTDGVDEENTNVTLVIELLSPLAEKPSKLNVVHRAQDYKKTISLADEHISSLFTAKRYTKSWNIPTLSFSGDSVELDVQLQYTTSDGDYYKGFTQTIPVYEEIEVEELSNITNETIDETTNETEIIEVTAEAANETSINATAATSEPEPSVIITGEEEHTSKKWIWFLVILISITLVAVGIYYIIIKKQKKKTIKKTIESISRKNGSGEEKKESIFAKAKEIIIHDVPSPEEGYDKLESYIKHALSQGKAEQEIKKILAAKGWIEDILDSYLKRLK